MAPSDSITTAWQLAPMNISRGSTFLTVPDTLAYTGEETKPPGSPIFWPTSTWSPAFTIQLAGFPMCMLMGMVTTAGGGIRSASMPAVFFRWGICTPCRFFNDILSTSNTVFLLSSGTRLSRRCPGENKANSSDV